ncbi:MAG: ABC transporter permease subunit [Bacteroidota bacterium]
MLTVSLWGGVGYLMVIYIAALQGVPQQLKEVALIDGANGFQAYRYVSLPMIFPALTIGISVGYGGLCPVPYLYGLVELPEDPG